MRHSNYFAYCTTEEEIKVEYRRLAFKCHPDHGGSAQQFQDLQQQYDSSLAKIKNPTRTSGSRSYGDFAAGGFWKHQDDFDFDWDSWLHKRREQSRRKVDYTWTQEIYVRNPHRIEAKLKKFMREPNRDAVRCFVKKYPKKWSVIGSKTHMTVQFRSNNEGLLKLISQLVELRDLLKDP